MSSWSWYYPNCSAARSSAARILEPLCARPWACRAPTTSSSCISRTHPTGESAYPGRYRASLCRKTRAGLLLGEELHERLGDEVGRLFGDPVTAIRDQSTPDI